MEAEEMLRRGLKLVYFGLGALIVAVFIEAGLSFAMLAGGLAALIVGIIHVVVSQG
jgi:hypothetical protein